MAQLEDVKLEQDRVKSRDRMRAKRAADPEGMKEYLRAWKAANPEKVKAHRQGAGNKKYEDGVDYKNKRREDRRRWRTNNPDKVRTFKATWYKIHTEEIKLQVKRAALKRIYGLTLEQRDELFASQDFRCAVCKSTEPGSTKGWHMDHCHNTNRVRGILCNHCNLMLGYAKDNPTTLNNAIEYLRNSGAS